MSLQYPRVKCLPQSSANGQTKGRDIRTSAHFELSQHDGMPCREFEPTTYLLLLLNCYPLHLTPFYIFTRINLCQHILRWVPTASRQMVLKSRQALLVSKKRKTCPKKKKPYCYTKQSCYTVFSKPKGALTFISACGDFHGEAFLKHYRCC